MCVSPGVAAGLGVQAAIESCAELQSSCVTVLGCPAEEGEGGKINMIDNGTYTFSLYSKLALD